MLGHLGMHPDHLIPRTTYLKNDIPIAGVAHQAGTVRFGSDPASSALDVNCKAHELDNLYVVDTSFFPSIGAVNPALTAMANAIRVGDHLLERLGASADRQPVGVAGASPASRPVARPVSPHDPADGAAARVDEEGTDVARRQGRGRHRWRQRDRPRDRARDGAPGCVRDDQLPQEPGRGRGDRQGDRGGGRQGPGRPGRRLVGRRHPAPRSTARVEAVGKLDIIVNNAGMETRTVDPRHDGAAVRPGHGRRPQERVLRRPARGEADDQAGWRRPDHQHLLDPRGLADARQRRRTARPRAASGC